MLTASELSALLMHQRLALPVLSPLAHVVASSNPALDEKLLEQRGLLRTEWTTAIALLARSMPALAVRRAAIDDVETTYVFRSPHYPKDQNGVVVRLLADGRLAIDVHQDGKDVLYDLVETFAPVEAAPPQVFDRTFTDAGLIALAACVDFVRTLFAASLIERCALAAVIIRREDLSDQIARGLEGNDNRFLVSLLGRLMPELAPAMRSGLADGIDEIESAGLLEARPDERTEYLPSAELLGVAFNLTSPIPSMVLSTTLGATGSERRLVVLRGVSLWHLEAVDGEARQGYRLQSVDGLTMLSHVSSYVLPKPAHGPVDRIAPAPQSAFCAACGSTLRAGASFCTQCGQAVAKPT